MRVLCHAVPFPVQKGNGYTQPPTCAWPRTAGFGQVVLTCRSPGPAGAGAMPEQGRGVGNHRAQPSEGKVGGQLSLIDREHLAQFAQVAVARYIARVRTDISATPGMLSVLRA